MVGWRDGRYMSWFSSPLRINRQEADMRNKLFNLSCGIAVMVAMLGAPAHGQAQSIGESVTKLSVTDIQRMLDTSEARSNQTNQTAERTHSVRRNAIVGALIGLAPSLTAGLLIHRYCNNEVVGGCSIRIPIALAAAGAGIGAALGAAGTDR
jgi:hypothetical protein